MSMDVQTVVANTFTINTDNFVLPALQGLSDADLLKRPSDQCNLKGGDFLGILLLDQFHHSGRIAYLRGYLTGKGWFPR